MKATKEASAAVLLLGGMLLGAPQALAQEMYDTSVPFQGDVLKEAPAPMVISFAEAIYLTNLRLVGADGAAWPLDWQKTEDDVFKVEFHVAKPLPPGSYQIEWTAYVRQHYHPDGGVIAFTIDPQAAPRGALTPAATQPTVSAPQAAPDSPDPALRAASAPPADH